MPHASILQASLNGGEVSPDVHARLDQKQQQSTLRRLVNARPTVRGPVDKRSGFAFQWETLDKTKRYRLVSFIATTTDVYILEFADKKIRVFKNDAQVADTRTLTVSTDVVLPGNLLSHLDAGMAYLTGVAYTGPSLYDPAIPDVLVCPHGVFLGTTPVEVYFTVDAGSVIPPTLVASTSYWLRAQPLTGIPKLELRNAWPNGVGPLGVFQWSVHPTQGDALAGTNPIVLTGGTGTLTLHHGPPLGQLLMIETPWTEAELPNLRIATNEDVAYILHENRWIWRLQRLGGDRFQLVQEEPAEGPWDDYQLLSGNVHYIRGEAQTRWVRGESSNDGVTPGGPYDAVVFVGDKRLVGENVRAGLFSPDDVGKYIRVARDAITGAPADANWDGVTSYLVCRIYEVGAGVVLAGPAPYDNVRGYNGLWTAARVVLVKSYERNPPVNCPQYTDLNLRWYGRGWKFGHAFMDGPTGPRVAAFLEDRLLISSGGISPNTIYGSKTGLFENFSPTDASNQVTADSAIKFTPASDKNQYDATNFMITFRDFLFGSAAGLWSVGKGLSPGNESAYKTNARGSAFVEALATEDFGVFVGAGKDRLHGVRFRDTTQGYDLVDFSAFAAHITSIGIEEMVLAEEPDPTIYCRMADGTMAAFAFNSIYELQAWYRIETDGFIESITVAPSRGNTHSQVYVLVQRYRDDGVTPGLYRYVEKLTETWSDDQVDTEAFFVDSGLSVIAQGTVPQVGPLAAIKGIRAASDAGRILLRLDAGYLAAGETRTVYIDGLTGKTGALLNKRVWNVTRPIGAPADEVIVYTQGGEETVFPDGVQEEEASQLLIHALSASQVVLMPHLAGREVVALADGAPLGPFTVDPATGVTITGRVGQLHIGLPYAAQFELQPPEADAGASTTFGSARSIKKVVLSLARSIGGKIRLLGAEADVPSEWIDVLIRRIEDPMDSAIPFFTGNTTQNPVGGFMYDQRLEIVQDVPGPFTLRGVLYRVDFRLGGEES